MHSRIEARLFGLVLFPFATSCGLSITYAADRPNIVVILADNMGFSDIGCYGSEIETPHIDRLAEHGLRFSQFYNSGRCCPTRASLMTGLHPHQVGIGHMTAPPGQPLGIDGPYQGHLNQQCVTLAQVLRDAGYHTLMTGKWHLGANEREDWPLQRGFDQFYGGLSGAFNYFKPGGDRGLTLGNENVGTGDDYYVTDALTDKACEFITAAKKEEDKPFFLYLAYNAPHWPVSPKVADFEKYRGNYRSGWLPVMKKRFAKQQELGLFEPGVKPAPHEGPKWKSLSDEKRDDLDAIMAAYAGCIDSIDQNVGKLVAYLEENEQLDNTIVLLLSDNGACHEGGVLGKGSEMTVRNPPLETVDGVHLGRAWANACNTPLRLYKHFLHEGGACTPLVVHWPQGIADSRQGQWARQVAYLPDVMATCVELSGGSYPENVPACVGKSMTGAFVSADAVVHEEPIYWEHEGNAAMRQGKWKLVREYQKPWELYDMQADPTEMNDLANEETALAAELIDKWETWATEHQVAFPQRFNMYEFLNKKRKAAGGRS